VSISRQFNDDGQDNELVAGELDLDPVAVGGSTKEAAGGGGGSGSGGSGIPPRRGGGSAGSVPSSAANRRAGPRQFLHEVNVEMRKVAWPTRETTINYSIVVLVTLAILMAIIFALDLGFSNLAMFLFK
jgi:preprotein translocase SecE subunit